jgi:hypothetical protein
MALPLDGNFGRLVSEVLINNASSSVRLSSFRVITMKNNIRSTEFVRIISSIVDVLKDTAHSQQTDFLVHLIDSWERGDFEKSIEDINGAELWGGSGSIWDIEMPDSVSQDRLNRSLTDLLKQMSNENILGKRAKSVYKLLVK